MWYHWVILLGLASLSVVVGLSLLSSTARIHSLDASGVHLTTILGRSIQLSWREVRKVMRYKGARRTRLVLYLKRPRFLAFRRAYIVRLPSWDYPQRELADHLPKYADVSEQEL